jgi:putative oxidoreductase
MPASRDTQALTAVRLGLAILLMIHGWARLLAGGVNPFGDWLGSQGIPLGHAIAWGITLYEIAGMVLLALGRWVTPLCLLSMVIYATGAVMVHLPAGWFVVGLGRNGMEYSVLILLCLGALAYAHAPKRASQSPE